MTYRKSEILLRVIMCVNNSHTNSLYMYMYMVLGKTEYLNAVNVRYTFQLLIFFLFFFLLTNFKIAYIDKDTIIITDITHTTNNPNIYTSHNKITNNKVQ